MKINRQGCTRLVILLKKVVIKIPNFTYSWEHFVRGLWCNLQEVKTYKVANIKNSYTWKGRHLICPVLWSSWGGWVVVMRRAETLSEEQWNKIDVDIRKHKKYFRGDDTISNYGILNGKIVKIDYGN